MGVRAGVGAGPETGADVGERERCRLRKGVRIWWRGRLWGAEI